MICKTIELETCRLHLIKTQKFKTIDIRIMFSDKFKKEEITKRNFLLDILTYSSKTYNSRRELCIKCQDLYSLNLNSSNLRIGNYLISKIGISFLNPKYTEKNMLEKSIDLLIDIIFNPNVSDNRFDSKIFEIIKKELESERLTVKEQPKIYSLSQMLKEMGGNKPYNYHGYCYKEDLDALNEENLFEFYQMFIKNSMIDVYVVGDFDFEEVTNIIRNKLKFVKKNKIKDNVYVFHDLIRKRYRRVIEKSNFKQSKLVIGLKTNNLTEYERNYVSNIYNLILGGNADSLLMRNVRLKESLVYYIFSTLNKTDNIIIISCGIEVKNFEKTLKIIKKTLKSIKDGLFEDDDVKKSQMEYITSLDTALNNPGSIIDLEMSKFIGISESIEKRKKEINRVTKQDVINISKKVSMDIVYLLEGE